MRLQKYMVNELSLPSWITRMFGKVKDELKRMSFSEVEKKCSDAFYKIINDKDIRKDEEAWEEFFKNIAEFGVSNDNMIPKFLKIADQDAENKRLERGKRSTAAMNKYFGMTESIVNEDARHWWELIKGEAFPTLAFYPALQVWLELDKMLKGTQYSGKVIGFYAAFWLILVSGKYITQWNKWRKDNPGEFAAERSQGKGGIV